MSGTPEFSADQLLGHFGWARSLARQLVVDAATADDVVQSTWIAALRAKPDARGTLKPWLERTLRNFAANVRRDRSVRTRHERSVEIDRTVELSAEEVVQKAEGQQRLTEAVLQLEDPYREAVLLRYFEDLSAAAIARRTNTPAGTIRWRLHEGLRMLRERFEQEGNRDGAAPGAWCAFLLPLSGLRSLADLQAASATITVAGGASTGKVLASGASGSAQPSFVSLVLGVMTMKFLFVFGASVLALVYLLFGLDQAPSGPSTDATAGADPGGGFRVAAAADPDDGELPAQRSTVVEAPTAQPTVVLTEPEESPATPWRASVRVRVVDAATGKPLARIGGIVNLGMSAEGGHAIAPDALAWSDSSGLLIVPVPAPYRGAARHRTSMVLQTRAPGWANVVRAVAVPSLIGDGDLLDLGTIELDPGGVVRGVVRDVAGAPVAGAEIYASGRDDAKIRSSHMLMATPTSQNRTGKTAGMSDEFGRYELHGLLAGRCQLSASVDEDRKTVDHLDGELAVRVVAGDVVEADIVVKRMVALADRIHVHVIGPDGQPVHFAHVEFESGRGRFNEYTDEQGDAWGAAMGARSATVTVSPPEGHLALPDRVSPVVKQGVKRGERIVLQLHAAEMMSLRVASAGGQQIERAVVRLTTVAKSGFLGLGRTQARDLEVVRQEDVDPDGAVVIEAMKPTVRFMAEVVAFGHQAQSFGPFEVSGDLSELTFELTPRDVVVVRVTDASGQPVDGARVSLHHRTKHRTQHNGLPVWLDPTPADQGATDADGVFSLTVREDRAFFVRVTSEGFAPLESQEMSPQLEQIRPRDLLEVVLSRGGSIAGTLAIADGTPAAGQIVVASRGDGAARTTRVGEDGTFRFDLMTPGSYRVQRFGRDIESGSSFSSSSLGTPHVGVKANCQVVDGQVAHCDLGADPSRLRTLEGFIRIGGVDLDGASIEAAPADIDRDDLGVERWKARIESGGRFSIAVVPGELLLEVRDGEFAVEVRHTVGTGRPVKPLKIDVPTSQVSLSGLPRADVDDGVPSTLFARWREGDLQVTQRFEPSEDAGDVQLRLPRGSVEILRLPTRLEVAGMTSLEEVQLVVVRTVQVR